VIEVLLVKVAANTDLGSQWVSMAFATRIVAKHSSTERDSHP